METLIKHLLYICYMASKMVNIRVDEKLLKAIDKMVKDGFYSNRGEFIKASVRERVEDYLFKMQLRKTSERLGKKAAEAGWDGRIFLTREEKEKAHREVLKKAGLDEFIR